MLDASERCEREGKMKTLLLLLLLTNSAVADYPATRNGDYVTVSLPALEAGSEYHDVLVNSGLTPIDEIFMNREYTFITEDSSGTISAILCTEFTCTPIRGNWSVFSVFDIVCGILWAVVAFSATCVGFWMLSRNWRW